MAAHRIQALLAPNRPEGMCARGPSMRSAKTVSMIAWRRWAMSASGVGSSVSVKKRVIPPDREECVGVAGVFDAAHDQPCGHRVRCGSKGGVGGFGDFGIGDPVAGVGVTDRTWIGHRGPRLLGDGTDCGGHGGVLAQHY